MTETPETFGHKELEFTRILSAPPARVWKAWTDPLRAAQWWGPKGFTAPVCEMDVRVGGRIWIVMRGPDGADHPMSGTYVEVVEPERLVFLAWPEDLDGVRYADTRTTVTFAPTLDGKTRLTVRAEAAGLRPGMLEGMEQGWSESLDRLSSHVDNLW